MRTRAAVIWACAASGQVLAGAALSLGLAAANTSPRASPAPGGIGAAAPPPSDLHYASWEWRAEARSRWVWTVEASPIGNTKNTAKPPWWSGARVPPPVRQERPPALPGQGDLCALYEAVCGWPEPVFYAGARVWFDESVQFGSATEVLAGAGSELFRQAVPRAYRSRVDQRQPSMPRVLWRGLFADTLFWSVCLSVMPLGWAAWRSVARRRRRSRGLCVACGFDLRGLEQGRPCPECGNAGN